MIVTAPRNRVAAIAARLDVRRIDLAERQAPPPSVSAGRYLIKSDALYNNLAASGGFSPHIAVLDTGSPMPLNHLQFSPRSRVELEKDCFHSGDYNCVSQAPGWNSQDLCNHGTSSAAILTALGTQGDAYRGVTGFQIGTYRIYDDTCHGGPAEAIRAIAAAVADGYPVQLVETQQAEDDSGGLATQANQAFNAGVAVIATNGNFGPGASTVRSPAVGHNVIGVGSQHFYYLTTYPDQSLGPTADGRIKPDVQAPSGTYTASSENATAIHEFGGTSGAAPYAAGAAALLGAYWSRAANGVTMVAPGQIYAGLIDAGIQTAFNNTVGAGRISLMDPAWQQGHGFVDLGSQQYVDVPIGNVPSGTVKTAIWWSDLGVGVHNDMDLSLHTSQNWYPSSNASAGVFEKSGYGPVQTADIWYVRIIGYYVPTGSQRVYYSWHVVP